MAKNNRMHVVALQTSIGTLTSEKLALQTALNELGYCHEQTTQWITDNASGAGGLISTRILFEENKAALAEAIEANRHLTDDAEFQAHRYTLQSNRLAQTARCAADTSDRLYATEKRLHKARCVVVGMSAAILVVTVAATIHALAVVL